MAIKIYMGMLFSLVFSISYYVLHNSLNFYNINILYRYKMIKGIVSSRSPRSPKSPRRSPKSPRRSQNHLEDHQNHLEDHQNHLEDHQNHLEDH